MIRAPLAAIALAAGLLQAPSAPPPPTGSVRPPPRVASGVAPDTVTVGDRFQSYLSVRHAPGARVEFAPLPAGDSLQMYESLRTVRSDSVETVVAYPLTAWVAGVPLRRVVPVVVTVAGSAPRTYRVELRLPVVRPVLPTEADVQPRPPKGLFPPPARDTSWWWLAALGGGLLAALLGWRLLRRSPPRAAPDPRAEALAELGRIADPQPGDTVGVAAHYTAVTRVLRRYLARLHPEWGEDLTTTELMERLHADPGSELDRAELAALLGAADPVKFGAQLPPRDAAPGFRERVRGWIDGNPGAGEEPRRAA